ncbi:hypothetical protein [Gemelliphila palaticanis]|uniref:Uncharacterized protein n=1 Tax=Gemelliphila palaticanis TaxID=81950 RepID=A0ABX2SZK4_9BACL|nr:hypothetical protein [Gemella palaticanis]MBF0715800.1 hypothetical protein [Gemella palaticanis]NYS47730.1 hypothetical protein [Gemella palaticanis]
MEELKYYLKSRIENIEKEIKTGKDKFKNIKKKEELLNVIFLIDLMDKHNINSKNILEVIQVETVTDSSQIRLFDDCDTENQDY